MSQPNVQPLIVISGAGIAGPALARGLTANGYRVLVVERAPSVRPGGQTVDLRGIGADVAERLGVLDAINRHKLDQRGAAWVAADGTRRAEMPVTAFDGRGMVSKLEILRGDLAQILYDATREQVEYRFGTHITALTPHPDSVTVELSDGDRVEAELVVGADGPHSAVRRLAFGPEEEFVRPLGGYHAWFTAPDTVGLDGWFLLYQAPGGLNVSMRPSHQPGISKAGLAFRSEPLTYDRHDPDAQRALLTERLAGAGWRTDELLAAAGQADDFYFDAFAQVHMDRWSRGRIVLVGDAGYCASPLSGLGTTLALVGAYVLAGEIGPASAGLASARVEHVLAAYDTTMRPFVDRCQDLPNGIDRYAPMSAVDIAITARVMTWMQRFPFRALAARMWFSAADSMELPNY